MDGSQEGLGVGGGGSKAGDVAKLRVRGGCSEAEAVVKLRVRASVKAKAARACIGQSKGCACVEIVAKQSTVPRSQTAECLA